MKAIVTKLLISLSSPELVQEEYTGTNGLYSAVTPDERSCKMVIALAKALGFDVPADKLHCTVMYSKGNSPEPAVISCDRAKQYTAQAVRLQHWNGHDDKGYLTLALDSPELTAEHQRLLALGCKADFDYNPHITIWSDIELTAELEEKIDRFTKKIENWPKLNFNSQFIGDMKD